MQSLKMLINFREEERSDMKFEYTVCWKNNKMQNMFLTAIYPNLNAAV